MNCIKGEHRAIRQKGIGGITLEPEVVSQTGTRGRGLPAKRVAERGIGGESNLHKIVNTVHYRYTLSIGWSKSWRASDK